MFGLKKNPKKHIADRRVRPEKSPVIDSSGMNRAARRADAKWEKGKPMRERKAKIANQLYLQKEARAAREKRKVEAAIKRRAEREKLKAKNK